MKRWATKPLGELCDVEGGNAAPQGDENFKEGKIPFVRMKDLGRYHLTNNLTQTDDKLTEASAANNRMKLFGPGCILFPRSGSVALNHRAILGVRACIVSHIGVLQNLRPEITAGYLYLYLTTFDMTALAKKTTGVDSIAFADVKRIPVPVPPLAEQERIVKLLDAADESRKLRAKADSRTAELIPSLFHEMFGDPITNPHKWQKVTLDEVCAKLTDGTHFSPPPAEIGIPYITAKHLREYGLDFELDPTYVAPEHHREIYARCDPKPGDVLYIKDGATTGLAAVNRYEFEFSMLSSLALMRPNPAKCESEFLCAWLNDKAVKTSMLGQMAGAAIRRLTLAKLNKSTILLPPLPLQQEFAKRVSEIRMLETKQAASRLRLEALFQSLLYHAFNGEL